MAEVLNRSGEDAERRSPQERGRELANTYAKSKEKRTLLESAGSATIPDFKYVDLMRGLYGEDQVSALEAEIARREARATMEPPRPATRPAPFSEAARPASTETGESGSEKRMSKNGVKKAIALGVIGATAAGAVGGVVGGYLAHDGAKDLPLSYELHGTLENEDAEAMEQAESIDVSDQYAGHFANDEGTGYNERKSSPYSYGESLEGAEHDEVMKELEHIVFHEPTLFAPLYFDLDDSAKLQFTLEDGTVVDTKTMSPSQLADLMKNEEAHRIMGQHYLLTIGQEYSDTLLNGPHANVYGEKVGDGQIFSSENVRAVHCVTNENNSQAITFRYEIPGKSGQYATTTLRLGCGLQVVRPEKEAEKIITSTPEIDPDKPVTPTPDKPDEPGGGDEEQKGKTPFTEEQVFENEDSPETTNWDHDTTGPGSVGEKPTTSSSTENMNGGGNTGAKPESSSSQKPATQEQRSASQETSSQKAPETTQQEQKKAETQQQATQKQETHQESVRQQSDKVVEEHTDSNGNVDLDALLDMD